MYTSTQYHLLCICCRPVHQTSCCRPVFQTTFCTPVHHTTCCRPVLQTTCCTLVHQTTCCTHFNGLSRVLWDLPSRGQALLLPHSYPAHGMYRQQISEKTFHCTWVPRATQEENDINQILHPVAYFEPNFFLLLSGWFHLSATVLFLWFLQIWSDFHIQNFYLLTHSV